MHQAHLADARTHPEKGRYGGRDGDHVFFSDRRRCGRSLGRTLLQCAHLQLESIEFLAHRFQPVQAQLERGEGHLFYALYGLDGPAPDAAQTATLKKKLLASVPNTMVSNIGTIEAAAADPLLRNLSFALFPMPYQSLFTAASTYGDQLTLNIGFNAARLGPHADRLINSLEELLIQSAA